ncbi:hypothetical protein MKY15_21730 [Sporosarcina sp. FSL K6-1540]|uniref:hypothetical protein n=1 Tax=Sporosarcina sp. FSL K6-1540 TaxID=2921555 RepID=UPI00315AF781
MLDFLSSGLFWTFVGGVTISSCVKGFFSIYHRESHTGSDLLIVGLTILNTGIYIASFILLGWITAIVLFILGSTVGGFAAAEAKHRLHKKSLMNID